MFCTFNNTYYKFILSYIIIYNYTLYTTDYSTLVLFLIIILNILIHVHCIFLIIDYPHLSVIISTDINWIIGAPINYHV